MRTACRTTNSAGRTPSAGRTRTAGRRRSTRPESNGRSRLPSALSLFYWDGETDVLLETDLNHLQECQKFSGHGRRRRARDRYQQTAAIARVSREAHRSRSLPRLREHPQPGVEGAAAAEVEEG